MMYLIFIFQNVAIKVDNRLEKVSIKASKLFQLEDYAKTHNIIALTEKHQKKIRLTTKADKNNFTGPYCCVCVG